MGEQVVQMTVVQNNTEYVSTIDPLADSMIIRVNTCISFDLVLATGNHG